MSNDLVQFLRDRLDEDEQTARATEWCPATMTFNGWDTHRINADESEVRSHGATITRGTSPEFADHITRHDPERTLREVEAGRRVISDYEDATRTLAVAGPSGTPYDLMTGATNTLKRVLRLLAAVYADHPDYCAEWRP
jgi:hypothetical protein